MGFRLASDLRPGETVWLDCQNGRTGGRIISLEHCERRDVAIYASPDCARDPVVRMEVALGRAAAVRGGYGLRRWELWFEADDRLEIVEKAKGAR